MRSKALIIGSPFSGKTTLFKLLKQHHPELNIREHDEALLALHDGAWPTDGDEVTHSWNKVVQHIIGEQPDIFLSAYIQTDLVKEMKSKGYRVVQLTVTQDSIAQRLEERKRTEPHNTARYELKGNLEYQDKLAALGLADLQISTDDQSAEETLRKVEELIGE